MWNQITLEVPDDLKDAVSGELSDCGVAGIWEETAKLPGSTRLVAYFADHRHLDGIEVRIRTIFERGRNEPPHISRKILEECDWTEQWRKSYTSFPVGD